MDEFFLEIVNMSITASWIVFAVVVLRLFLKKAPKWLNVLLWGVVGLRLVLPFSLESIFSLIPSAQTVSPQMLTDATPQINTGIPSFNNMVNPVISHSFAPNPVYSATPLQIWSFIAAVVWLAGVAALVLYSIISYLRLKRKVATAVLLQDNIYQSESVGSPFVLGIFNPKIYLPFAMDEKDREQVIAHETAHIRRRDYLWKPLGFFLLTLHWFNPLIWLAYVLLCRDIELACDEKVIKNWDDTQKAEYSQALLNCSVHRKLIAACPLAFGEVGVKNRVKSVLNYKKPAFWLVVTAIVVSVAVAVCFLTNPATVKLQDIEGYGIHQRVSETTSVMVRNGNGYEPVGSLENEVLQPLFDLKISAKEISNDRSWERDDTHTLILHIPDKDRPWVSYIPGIAIHFNEDFTAVWANDSKGEGHFTLSYQVKNPEKAKEVYFALAEYDSSVTDVGGADEPESVVTSVSEPESAPSEKEESKETSSLTESAPKESNPQKESSKPASSKPASSKVPVVSSQPTPSENTSSAYKPTYFEPLTEAKIKEISACVEKDNYEYGEGQYFGTYNGYDVLLVSQINGVETEDDKPLAIGEQTFYLGQTEWLIAYKSNTYIPLTDAYAKGYVSGEDMKNIRYLYGNDFHNKFTHDDVLMWFLPKDNSHEKKFTPEDFPTVIMECIERQYWYPDDMNSPGYSIHIKLPINNRRNVINVIKELEKIDGVIYAEPNYIYELDW